MNNKFSFILTLINPLEHNPSWEANSLSFNHKMPRTMAYYWLHKNLPFVPIISQTNPPHKLPNYFFMIHFNIIFPSTSNAFKQPPSILSNIITCMILILEINISLYTSIYTY